MVEERSDEKLATKMFKCPACSVILMNIWDKLLQVNIENKERFERLFSETVDKVRKNSFSITVGEVEKEDYYIVIEETRMDGYFVHIVPKQVYNLFKEMQLRIKNQSIGFSVVAGEYAGKNVRVSCFGVRCDLLGKSLFKKQGINK